MKLKLKYGQNEKLLGDVQERDILFEAKLKLYHYIKMNIWHVGDFDKL